jgi:hypothetical protein
MPASASCSDRRQIAVAARVRRIRRSKSWKNVEEWRERSERNDDLVEVTTVLSDYIYATDLPYVWLAARYKSDNISTSARHIFMPFSMGLDPFDGVPQKKFDQILSLVTSARGRWRYFFVIFFWTNRKP